MDENRKPKEIRGPGANGTGRRHDTTGSREPPSDRPASAVRSTLAALFRVPLFYKLVIANTFFLVVAVLATASLAPASAGADRLSAPLLLTLGGLVVLSALFNGALVALALAPLRGLEETARRVRRGDLSARAPGSPVADRSLATLRAVFNHMLDGIEELRARYRELTTRALEAEERERERISRRLLDETAQALAAVLLRLQIAESGASTNSDGHDSLRGEVAGALEDVRRLARDLRPPEIHEVGLRAALDAYARTVAQTAGIPVRVEGRLEDGSVCRDTSLAAFRILQEAVRNAARHARASRILVRLGQQRGWLEAEVIDDGVGFDPEVVRECSGAGLGLFELCERAALLGGNATVESAPGAGTRVRVQLPLRSALSRVSASR